MYIPKDELLKKYADIIVKFALNNGKGINSGEVVLVKIPESAKPLLKHIQLSILEAGGHLILDYMVEGLERDFYETANEEQLIYTPHKYNKALFKEIDHVVRVISEWNPKMLAGVDSNKVISRTNIIGGTFRKNLMEKEKKGELSWTIILYPTLAMANEANLTIEEYWDEVVKACYLNENDPVVKWREVNETLDKQKKFLNDLNIEYLDIQGDRVNLKVKIGKNRAWRAGDGCNIPSFEVFTSPNMYGSEGEIYFSEPLYVYDNLVEGVYLKFKDGKVIKATAKEGENVLHKMIESKGADRLGEISLTDKRLSRIDKFMAETLYDENAGGKYGNMHLALGQSFYECYKGNYKDLKIKDFKRLGFNHSHVHTDIVTRLDRTVFAITDKGKRIKIYENGSFLLD